MSHFLLAPPEQKWIGFCLRADERYISIVLDTEMEEAVENDHANAATITLNDVHRSPQGRWRKRTQSQTLWVHFVPEQEFPDVIITRRVSPSKPSSENSHPQRSVRKQQLDNPSKRTDGDR
jgi:hypothetical protein